MATVPRVSDVMSATILRSAVDSMTNAVDAINHVQSCLERMTDTLSHDISRDVEAIQPTLYDVCDRLLAHYRNVVNNG